MIIKASARSGARNLANHLASTKDNDHVTIHEVRGLVGQSLQAAFLEIDASSHATRCEKPLFSVSFNPPIGAEVTHDQFEKAFNQLEQKLGLVDQPRIVVFHEKEARRHAHVVWSRIDVDKSKAIHMSHFKTKCTDISRGLYLEHGWELPKGLERKQDRDPFQVSIAEWQAMKRKDIDPRDIKQLSQDSWQSSDNLSSFKLALEERNLFLARGDKRGFVVLDHQHNVYSLSRVGGIKTKELKARLGAPDQLYGIEKVSGYIRKSMTKEVLGRIDALKARHKTESQPLKDKKAQLVFRQRAERRELSDEQRVKRHLLIKSGRDKFRRGVRGIFDRVSGRHKRLTLINRKKGELLKARQMESREKLIFRQNRERSELQKSIVALRHQHRQERTLLAKRVHEYRQSEVQRVRRSTDLDQWTKARDLSKEFGKASSEKERTVDRGEKPSRDRPRRRRTRQRDLE
ncbi:MAG: relaxase/mobilization nuclease domain-containing protein [Cellvibrionaceae bacterium]